MDTAQWAQGIGVVKPMEAGSNSKPAPSPMLERKARPQKDQALNCPRCNSTNTKFCYYNNYSLSQPRYFCKTCRRYWTEGGSLRNVPVGGGSRKNKRSVTSTPPSSSKKLPDLTILTPNNFPQNQSSASQNPKIHQGQDLNLAYPPPPAAEDYNTLSKFIEVPYTTEDQKISHTSSSTTCSQHQLSAMELLKSSRRGLNNNSFMPTMSLSDSSTTMYNSTGGFHDLQEFKPAGLNFSFERFENNGYGGIQGIHQDGSGGGARILFPVEDLKQQVPSTQGDSTGYWNGMLGGAGSW